MTHRILITGARGMLGRYLQDEINNYLSINPELEKDYSFFFTKSSENDLTNDADVNKIFNHFKPTIVIHLAANVGGLFKNLHQNLEMYESNVQMNYNIIRACRLSGVKRLISILSTCIFPDGIEMPLVEEKINCGEPHYSNSGYAYAKRLIQNYTNIINRSGTELSCINIIPTNLYGYYDNFSKVDGHVLPALLHKFHTEQDIVLPGTGSSIRQFLYTADLAKIIVEFLFNPKLEDTLGDFIVAGAEENNITIKQLVDIISSKFGKDYRFNNDSKQDGQYIKTASTKKLLELFREKEIPVHFTSLDTGIEKTVKWFLENYNTSNIRI